MAYPGIFVNFHCCGQRTHGCQWPTHCLCPYPWLSCTCSHINASYHLFLLAGWSWLPLKTSLNGTSNRLTKCIGYDGSFWDKDAVLSCIFSNSSFTLRSSQAVSCQVCYHLHCIRVGSLLMTWHNRNKASENERDRWYCNNASGRGSRLHAVPKRRPRGP